MLNEEDFHELELTLFRLNLSPFSHAELERLGFDFVVVFAASIFDTRGPSSSRA